MPEIITLGEALVDLVSSRSGVNLIEAPSFEKAPGGAPANVAAGISKLGITSGFIGLVGDDPFGHFLAKTLEDVGVDISELHFSTEARTGLAFVSLKEDGERDFVFYRHPSADMLLSSENISPTYLQQAKILHFGSISTINEPPKSATMKAVMSALADDLTVSFDPNIRLNLWPNTKQARTEILNFWQHAQIIKLSDEELGFLSNRDDYRDWNESDLFNIASEFWHNNLHLLVITRGKKGAFALTKEGSIQIPGFDVRAIDTTGAGDGFMAGLLTSLLQERLLTKTPSREEMSELLRFANAVGALTTTKKGAIPALPSLKDVHQFLIRSNNLSKK